MDDGLLIPLLGIAGMGVVMLLLRRWLHARWLANGMSPTRAAILSVAITYVPILGALIAIGWATGRPISSENWPIVLLALALPALFGFGLRRALFDYMERHGVRDEMKRLEAVRRAKADRRGADPPS